APFNDEAFKFATLVVELTTSGAVPLDTVETSCPETESEEPVAAPILGVVRVGPVPNTTLPVPVAPAAVTPPIEILVPKVCSPLQACAMLVSAICPVLAGRVAVTVPSAPATGSSVTRPEVALPMVSEPSVPEAPSVGEEVATGFVAEPTRIWPVPIETPPMLVE